MRKIFIVLFCAAFLCQAAPNSGADDDLLVQNTTPDSTKWPKGIRDWWKNRQNRRACETYIDNYKNAHKDDYEIIIIDDSGIPHTERGSKYSGKNRVVYAARPMDIRGFLGCLDGSAVGTDRADTGRQLGHVIYCGSHGDESGKGPTSFVNELNYRDAKDNLVDAAGAPAWQKTVTKWEKDLAARGKTTQGLFTGNAKMDVQICQAGDGKFPQFMANEMPEGATVVASKEDVLVGGYGVLGNAYFKMEPGSEVTFKPGGKTNSQIVSEREIAYLAHKYDLIRSQFDQAQKGDVANIKDYQDDMAVKFVDLFDDSGRFEETEEIAGLRDALWEARSKAIRGEMTVEDMDAISEQVSQTLEEKGSLDDYFEIISAEAPVEGQVGIPSFSSPATPLIVQPGEPAPEIAAEVPQLPEVTPAEVQLEPSASYDRLRERRRARKEKLQGTPPPTPEAAKQIQPPTITEQPAETPQWSTGELMQEGMDRYLENARQKIQAGRQNRGQQEVNSQAYQAQAAQERQLQIQQSQAMMQQVAGIFKTFNAMNEAYNQQQVSPAPHTSADAGTNTDMQARIHEALYGPLRKANQMSSISE